MGRRLPSTGAAATRRAAGACLTLVVATLAIGVRVASATLPSLEEVLGRIFPQARLERQTEFLTSEQLRRVQELSGVDGQRALITRYLAVTDGTVQGFGYVDSHRVRTLPETLLVVVDPDGRVLRVEVVAFGEPMEYLPPERWYAQFELMSLSRELALKRGVRPITGATLTARAATDAVRRVLAVHRVLEAGGDDR